MSDTPRPPDGYPNWVDYCLRERLMWTKYGLLPTSEDAAYARARAELAEVRAALEPFAQSIRWAENATHPGSIEDEEDYVICTDHLEDEHYRRAAALLAQLSRGK